LCTRAVLSAAPAARCSGCRAAQPAAGCSYEGSSSNFSISRNHVRAAVKTTEHPGWKGTRGESHLEKKIPSVFPKDRMHRAGDSPSTWSTCYNQIFLNLSFHFEVHRLHGCRGDPQTASRAACTVLSACRLHAA
ncbi:hypothetical protein CIB84_005723, partial [Bambusicola thoracicus]